MKRSLLMKKKSRKVTKNKNQSPILREEDISCILVCVEQFVIANLIEKGSSGVASVNCRARWGFDPATTSQYKFLYRKNWKDYYSISYYNFSVQQI